MTNLGAPHLLHVFATFAAAGPQVRTVGLIEAFGPEFRHTIVALDGRTDARELLSPSAAVTIVPPAPKRGTPLTVARLARLEARLAPDLVLTYNFGALDAVIANKLSRAAPLVHHEDGFNPDEVQGLKWRRVILRRLILPGVHAVVVISKNLERIALERFRLARELVHFIPNGIDVSRFEPADGHASLRRELAIPERAFVVGAVGHLRAEKNVGRLLEAAKQVDGAFVLILGDGALREELERAAAHPSLAGRVRFVGYQRDPRPYYRAMNAFAISSDTEQMPIALLEAMASGLAVVSTDVGDVRTILPDGESRFVTALGPNAAGALAESLATVARDGALRAKLGAANRQAVAQRFAVDSMNASYRSLYRAAIGAR